MKLLFSILFISLISMILFLGQREEMANSTLRPKLILNNQQIIGSEPYIEREYKIAIDNITVNKPEVLNSTIHNTLKELITSGPLRNHQYKISYSQDQFIFRDIYFDTYNDDLQKQNSSLRLRYRFKSKNSYKKFLNGYQDNQAKPSRVEIQSKTNKVIDDRDFISVKENRIEFLPNAAPIDYFFSQGSSQSLLPYLFKTVKTGRYNEKVIYPIYSILQDLTELKEKEEIRFLPKKLILSKRLRFHLIKKTPWGSGANPDHVFIITLDHYAGKSLTEKVSRERDLLKGDFSPTRVEIEVEFERNTSKNLDKEISEGKKQATSLENTRKLFLEHQFAISESLRENLNKKGYITKKAPHSKYLTFHQEDER